MEPRSHAGIRKNGIKWLSDTLPHILTLVLGTVVMGLCRWWLAPIYLLISFLGLLWFLTHICPYCGAYGSPSCPSGYGLLSVRLVSRKKGSFRKAFLRNIWSVALEWFIPLITGIVFLVISFDLVLLVLLGLFVLVSFVVLPLTMRKKGCANCPQRKNCPWKGN